MTPHPSPLTLTVEERRQAQDAANDKRASLLQSQGLQMNFGHLAIIHFLEFLIGEDRVEEARLYHALEVEKKLDSAEEQFNRMKLTAPGPMPG